MERTSLTTGSAGREACRIIDVGKRRDGGTRYWCLAHRADATAKYGRRSKQCRYADVPPILDSETLRLRLDHYKGGVALWGAVPPVYDTTIMPLDRGVHVHARRSPDGDKEVDATYRAVRVTSGKTSAVVSELDAIYFMVSSVFGFPMRYVECTHCHHPHLDKDWFSVHEHRRHLCSGCGKNFRDTVAAIGNPICGLRAVLGVSSVQPQRAKNTLKIKQSDFKGVVQIWGSNPAIIWTAATVEAEGIHIHAFDSPKSDKPALDDTFSAVVIDGIRLDPVMVRTYMAQCALPHLTNRITHVRCRDCGGSQFDLADSAFTPNVDRVCKKCRSENVAVAGRLRKVIANPMVEVVQKLAGAAPRPMQVHDMGLLPETL